jgi:hypothetical protein
MKAIESIVRSWRATENTTLQPGASDKEMDEAARKLGRPLSNEARALYALCNGAYVTDGNFMLHPLDGDEFSLVRASDGFRANQWPIPDEVVIFGSDGQGGSFGFWWPRTGASPLSSMSESSLTAAISRSRGLR